MHTDHWDPFLARVRGDRDRRVPAQRVVVVDRGALAGRAARAVHVAVPGERDGRRGRLAVGAASRPASRHLDVAFSEGGIGWVPMLIDRIDYVLDHSAVGSNGWDDPNLSPTDALRRNFWFCTIDIALDDRAARPHRHRPHLHRERLPARRLHLARHAAARASPGSRDFTADEVRKVTWENASKLFRHPGPARTATACTRGGLTCSTCSSAAAPSSTAPARRVATRRRRRSATAASSRSATSSDERDAARSTSTGSRGRARLRRPAHALRRAAAVGPDREPVAAARRHDRVRRQLRVHARARPSRRARRLPRPAHGARRGHPAARARKQGVPWDWKTFGDYLDRVETSGTAVNAGFLAGHSRAAARRDGRRRRRRRGDRRADRRDGARSSHDALDAGAMGFSTSQAHDAQRRRRQPGAVARRVTRDELVRLAGAVHSHPGTQLELIIAGCLNGFSDDEVDLMTDDVARRRPSRSTGTCSASRAAGNAREPARRRHARRRARAHASSRSRCRRAMQIRLSFLTGLRARRAARLARDDRHCRCPSASALLSDPGGARPARRAGALARGRRAREPRALGAARSRSRASPPETQAFEGRHDRRHREGTGQDAVRRAARHRGRRRTAHRPAARTSADPSPTRRGRCAPTCGATRAP